MVRRSASGGTVSRRLRGTREAEGAMRGVELRVMQLRHLALTVLSWMESLEI